MAKRYDPNKVLLSRVALVGGPNADHFAREIFALRAPTRARAIERPHGDHGAIMGALGLPGNVVGAIGVGEELHPGALSAFWGRVAGTPGQLIASTQSLESIGLAAAALDSDISYVRVEMLGGHWMMTEYEPDDLRVAWQQGIEVR